MKEYAGIDCGSATCKGVLMNEYGILGQYIRPTGWSPQTSAREIFEELIGKAGLQSGDVKVTATGYGRVSIPFADQKVTEITCHAQGAQYILPGVRTVIDIGGQDSKVISVQNGKVLDFRMNDKCAAGTGRFLEMSAHRMGLDMEEFAQCLKAGKSCSLSSMCAVFADSEIVSLLAAGKSREEVAGGVVRSVAVKAAVLADKIGVESPVLLTGGLSEMEGLKTILSEILGCEVKSDPLCRYAGAVGAALTGMQGRKRVRDNERI